MVYTIFCDKNVTETGHNKDMDQDWNVRDMKAS